MKVDDFDFALPADAIAQHPARPRDSARLMHVRADGVSDLTVRDLPGLLADGDVMVFNDTKVIPARLTGRRGEAKIEVTLHKRAADDAWDAFAKPARRLKAGDRIAFADGFSAEVASKGDGGEVRLVFNTSGAGLMAALEAFGVMPLPPYIKRSADGRAEDTGDYQTVFADRPGAVAAPTAGLHFTPDLLAAVRAKGATPVRLTLHVGAGTFLPVKADDLADHRMHSEWGEISAEAADTVNAARAAGGRVVAVGTTSLRLLESAADPDGTLKPFLGETAIFITPGYRFKIVERLMTNFHLPRSTLFMLVCAFAGMDRMKAAYRHAMDNGYRFYSYGDACFLEKAP